MIKSLKRIYVYQMGAFFSFSRKEWLTLAEQVVQSGKPNYLLPQDKELASKPAKIKRERIDDDGVIQYYCDDVSVRIVEPINWQLDDWKLELQAVK